MTLHNDERMYVCTTKPNAFAMWHIIYFSFLDIKSLTSKRPRARSHHLRAVICQSRRWSHLTASQIASGIAKVAASPNGLLQSGRLTHANTHKNPSIISFLFIAVHCVIHYLDHLVDSVDFILILHAC